MSTNIIDDIKKNNKLTKEEKLVLIMANRISEDWPKGWTCDFELEELGFTVLNDLGAV